MRYSLPFLILLNCIYVTGQVTFQDATDSYFGNKAIQSTLTLGVTDIDGDYHDDLIFLDRGVMLRVGLFRGVGNTLEFIELPVPVSGNPEWSFTVGDLDNDGVSEVITTGVYNNIKVYRLDMELGEFQLLQKLSSDAYGQGSNILDINNDGWNDYFLCNDDGESRVFLNDGTGKLIRENGMINFNTEPESDFSGNYGSEWIDIDDDGTMELYLAKCKAGVTDQSDPRRINQFFKKDNDGIYQNIADQLGLDIADQSWSTTMADLDNDGDLDAVIANHQSPHSILRNDNGSFTSIAYGEEGLISFAFQVMTADFDNDGFLDILFAGDKDYIFYNKGDFTFEIVEDGIGYYNIISTALGDINSDGFIDVLASYGEPILKVGNRADKLWINKGNDNNHVGFLVKGVDSNVKGTGVKIKIYGPWGCQQRTIRSGQSYGVVNSGNAYFGLGTGQEIDSVIVLWPGGSKDSYYNIQGNNRYLLTQGGCISPVWNIIGPNGICSTNGLQLDFNEDYQHIEWNTGEIGSTVSIDSSASIQAFGIDTNGCSFISAHFFIELIEENSYPILKEDTLYLCPGDPIILRSGPLIFVEWSNGSQENEIYPEISGTYTVMGTDFCNYNFVDSVFIIIHNPDIVSQRDTILKGESAILRVEGDIIKWYESTESNNPIHEGLEFITPPLSESTTYYVENSIYNPQAIFEVGANRISQNNYYSTNNINAAMRFDVKEDLLIQEIKCYTDLSGEREVLISNDKGEVVFSELYDIEVGENLLILNAKLPVGKDYTITTNSTVNANNFGFSGPRLERRNEDVFYPYELENVVEIHGSDSGPNYYYFFDWKILLTSGICKSERVAVEVFVDFGSSIDGNENERVLFLPNPVEDVLRIKLTKAINGYLEIHNMEGKMIYTTKISNQDESVSLESLVPGVYIVIVRNDEILISRKIVKL